MKYKSGVLVGVVTLLVLIWAHRMFTSGVNPFSSNFLILSLLTIFLVGNIYLTKKIGYNSTNSVAKFFGASCVLFIISSALKGAFFVNSAIDFQLHDTYYVIADVHILILFSLIFGFYAIAYPVIPKIIKRELNQTIGQIHYWLTTVGVFFLICLSWRLKMTVIPRRYYNVEGLNAYEQFGDLNRVITIIAILLLLCQVLFLVNLGYSWLRKPRSLK